jgi:hypothetical protein
MSDSSNSSINFYNLKEGSMSSREEENYYNVDESLSNISNINSTNEDIINKVNPTKITKSITENKESEVIGLLDALNYATSEMTNRNTLTFFDNVKKKINNFFSLFSYCNTNNVNQENELKL